MLHKLFISILVFTASCLMANSFSLVDNGDGSWGVGYESSHSIGGFQFSVDGATVNSASGGDATANGFMLSASGTTVLGFSLAGTTIPAGSGTLLNLDLDGTPAALVSLVVSDASGSSLDFIFDAGTEPADYIVEVGTFGNYFSPADLQIEAGETVQWVNMAGFHNVDGSTDTYPNNPDSFYSGSPSNDAWTYSFTFEVEGFYDYDCSPHASMGMVGTIMVGDVIETCDEASACNTGAEGECEFAEENFDCDGNCTIDSDCNGDCGGSAVVDDCGVCDGDGLSCLSDSVHIEFGTLSEGSIEILMTNAAPVAGFQFDISGLNITGSEGGSATANGFMMSASGSTVIGFSLTGGTIPAGEGQVLCNVLFSSSDEEFCLTEAVLSDMNGGSLDSSLGDCYSGPPVGCTDMSACNYDMDAEVDDGSCEFESDCTGECGGSAMIDDCGVCDGGNADMDCLGACNGDADYDCSGECNGDAVSDACGVCEGTETDPANCGCEFEVVSLGSASINAGDTFEIPLSLCNDDPISGIQVQFNDIPSWLDVVDIVATPRMDGMTMSWNPQDDGSTVVVGFSLTGSQIQPGDGALVHIQYLSVSYTHLTLPTSDLV